MAETGDGEMDNKDEKQFVMIHHKATAADAVSLLHFSTLAMALRGWLMVTPLTTNGMERMLCLLPPRALKFTLFATTLN